MDVYGQHFVVINLSSYTEIQSFTKKVAYKKDITNYELLRMVDSRWNTQSLHSVIT